jgi:hypothetical protein
LIGYRRYSGVSCFFPNFGRVMRWPVGRGATAELLLFGRLSQSNTLFGDGPR